VKVHSVSLVEAQIQICQVCQSWWIQSDFRFWKCCLNEP